MLTGLVKRAIKLYRSGLVFERLSILSNGIGNAEMLRGIPQFRYVNSGLVNEIETEQANKSLH
jgi:hypothetical protein